MAARLTFAAMVFFSLSFVGGCGRQPSASPDSPGRTNPQSVRSQPKLPPIDLALAGRRFELEVALTDDQHSTGLMGRKAVGENEGMLFVFQEDGPRQFWMKNCLISLDMLYLDRNGRIVGIRTLPPPDPTRPGEIPSYPFTEPIVRYVIELNAGTAKRLGLKTGDVIKLPHAALQKMAVEADQASDEN